MSEKLNGPEIPNIPVQPRIESREETEEREKCAERKILNAEDEAILTRGLEQLAKTLMRDEVLPRVIVLADTSARPLAYALDSVLKVIYELRDVPPPEFRFLQTKRSPVYGAMTGIFSDYHLCVLDDEGEASSAMWRALREGVTEAKMELDGIQPGDEGYEETAKYLKDCEEDQKSYNENFAKAEEDLRKMQERLTGIMREAGEGPVLFVDDYTGNGSTYAILRESFARVKQGKSGEFQDNTFEYFTFYLNEGEFKVNRLFRDKKIPLPIAGTSSEWDKTYSLGFSYRVTRDGKADLEAKKEASIGVRKGPDALAVRSEKNILLQNRDGGDITTKAQLRKEMRAIGDKVANELRDTLSLK